MYKKLCPKCQQPSFSSCDSGLWICPSCQNNLTWLNYQDPEMPRIDKPLWFTIKNHDNKTPQTQVSPYIHSSFD